jgi:hypothetical protein
MYFITDNNGLYTGLIVEELNGEQFYSEVPILEFFIKCTSAILKDVLTSLINIF